MAAGSGWQGSYNRSAKSRRSRYTRERTVRALGSVKTLRGSVNGNRRYRQSPGLPF